VRGLDEAGLGVAGVGEGPALVAEQLRFEQGLGDGGAVDVDEGAVAARPGLMDRVGQQPLAGAGLAQDQHGWQTTRAHLTGKELRHLFADRVDPRARAL